MMFSKEKNVHACLNYPKGHTYHTTSRRLTNTSTGQNQTSTGRGEPEMVLRPTEDYYLLHQIWVGAKNQFHIYW